MKDMGNAMLMYAQDNHGYLIPARLNTQSPNLAYQIDTLTYRKGGSAHYGAIDQRKSQVVAFHRQVHHEKEIDAPGRRFHGGLHIRHLLVPGICWLSGCRQHGLNLIQAYNRNITGIGIQSVSILHRNKSSAVRLLIRTFPQLRLQRIRSYRFSNCTSSAITAVANGTSSSQFTRPSERAYLAIGTQYYPRSPNPSHPSRPFRDSG